MAMSIRVALGAYKLCGRVVDLDVDQDTLPSRCSDAFRCPCHGLASKERVSARHRGREVRAAVRLQAIVRGLLTRVKLPALREQHVLRVNIERQKKRFKRDLLAGG